MKLRLQLFSLLASAFFERLIGSAPSAYITLPDQYLTANGEVAAAAIPPNHWPACACGIKIIYGAVKAAGHIIPVDNGRLLLTGSR